MVVDVSHEAGLLRRIRLREGQPLTQVRHQQRVVHPAHPPRHHDRVQLRIEGVIDLEAEVRRRVLIREAQRARATLRVEPHPVLRLDRVGDGGQVHGIGPHHDLVAQVSAGALGHEVDHPCVVQRLESRHLSGLQTGAEAAEREPVQRALDRDDPLRHAPLHPGLGARGRRGAARDLGYRSGHRELRKRLPPARCALPDRVRRDAVPGEGVLGHDRREEAVRADQDDQHQEHREGEPGLRPHAALIPSPPAARSRSASPASACALGTGSKPNPPHG